MLDLVSRLGVVVSRAFRRTAPDPFVIAIGLTVFTAALALAFGRYPPADQGILDRAETLLDAWRFADLRDGVAIAAEKRIGLWKLLEFAMQMCLILVTGHALAVTRPVRALIDSVARLPRSTTSAAATVSFVACFAALINWGLGLIVGALLAREVGRSLEARSIRAHYPLIAASGYAGLLVWHGGLSGSAPLSMTTPGGAAKVLSPQAMDTLQGKGIELDQTLFSPMNMVVTLGLLAIVPLIFALLAPRRDKDVRTAAGFPLPVDIASEERLSDRTVPERLDRSRIVVWLLAIPLIFALMRFAQVSSLRTLGLNEVNAAMLALGLVLHGSARSYMAAAEQGARGCAGIIIQFPLYAGIMAMMQDSGLVSLIAERLTASSDAQTIPVLSMISAAIVNLFIPSGGGQWAIQGPIALEAGLSAGVAPGKMIMSVAYGDQLTNMLQPFWALPLLAITGVRARDIVGYTALVMIAGALWMGLGLLLL